MNIIWSKKYYPEAPIGDTGVVGVGGYSSVSVLKAVIDGYAGGSVLWSLLFEPISGSSYTDSSTSPEFWASLNGPGTTTLTATLDGAPCGNTLRCVSTGGGTFPDYGSAAWETILSTPPAFWTNFRNSEEVP